MEESQCPAKRKSVRSCGKKNFLRKRCGSCQGWFGCSRLRGPLQPPHHSLAGGAARDVSSPGLHGCIFHFLFKRWTGCALRFFGSLHHALSFALGGVCLCLHWKRPDQKWSWGQEAMALQGTYFWAWEWLLCVSVVVSFTVSVFLWGTVFLHTGDCKCSLP